MRVRHTSFVRALMTLLLLLALLLPGLAPCGAASPCPWANLARLPSARALAACAAQCKAGALPPLPAPAAAYLPQLLARAAEFPAILPLLTCAVEAGVAPPSRLLLLEAASRKSGSLLAAVLQRGNASSLLGAGAWEASAPGRPAWSPAHALLSNRLHLLSLVQDVLRARPASGAEALPAFRASLQGLLAALRKHAQPADARALSASARALGVVEDDGAPGGPVAAAQPPAAVAAAALQPIANAVSLQLLRLLLASAGASAAAALAAQPDALGRTPLHLAAWAGSVSAVQLLSASAAAGAGGGRAQLTGARDALLRTPLHYACAAHHWEAAAALAALAQREALAEEAQPAAQPPAAPALHAAAVQALCREAWGNLTGGAGSQEAAVGAGGEGGQGASSAASAPSPPPPPPPAAPSGGWHSIPLPAPRSLAGRALAAAARERERQGLLGSSGALEVVQLEALLQAPERFVQRYFSPGVPFLLRGGAAALQGGLGLSFTRAALLARAGHCNVSHGAIPYSKAFALRGGSGGPSVSTLRRFVRSMTPRGGGGGGGAAAAAALGAPPEYVFEAAHPLLFNNLSASALVPAWLARSRFPSAGGGGGGGARQPLLLPEAPPRAQFFLGPAGSGAPFHFHKDAVNFLAHGRKQWWLRPPSAALYSVLPVAQWLGGAGEGGGANASACGGALLGSSAGGGSSSAPPEPCLVGVQEEGDALYVPAGWGHAVLNLQASVGFALEWSTALHPNV